MIIIMSPEIKKPSECPNTGIRITVLGSKHTLHMVTWSISTAGLIHEIMNVFMTR